jgi:hypothetical protein
MAEERSAEEKRRRKRLAGKVGIAVGAAGLLLFIVGVKRHYRAEDAGAEQGAPDSGPAEDVRAPA